MYNQYIKILGVKMLIKTDESNSMQMYQYLSSAVQPRPLAFVGTTGADGVNNLAPFSLFGIVSTNPAMISITVLSKMTGGEKDTLVNIKENQVFSVSVVSADLIKKIIPTGMEHPPSVDEFELAGLTAKKCESIDCVRVGESKIVLECKLREVINYGEEGKCDSVIMADVQAINIDDSLMNGPQVDVNKLDAIGHIMGPLFVTTRDKISPMG